jgi:hypothetical protein
MGRFRVRSKRKAAGSRFAVGGTVNSDGVGYIRAVLVVVVLR